MTRPCALATLIRRRSICSEAGVRGRPVRFPAPVVSELLLNPIDYLKNYNLQTGELLTPTAFKNGVVELNPDAPHGFRLVTPAQWWVGVITAPGTP